MKYIIVGLGNFGSTLSMQLTDMGHEVIAIDKSLEKVDNYKNQITHTICLDATDQQALFTLPLKETDIVVIGIGEDFGASVMATALFKQLNVKRIIGRAISPIHQKVLEAIGVDQIVRPEQEAAERLAKRLEMRGVIDSFDLGEDYNIIEATVPDRYIGQTVVESNIRNDYKVNVLTILRTDNSIKLWNRSVQRRVLGVVTAETRFEQNDVLVLFGRIKDIERLLHAD
ncbi:MAG: potassium channel family protein [Adhaeribacter sp.]